MGLLVELLAEHHLICNEEREKEISLHQTYHIAGGILRPKSWTEPSYVGGFATFHAVHSLTLSNEYRLNNNEHISGYRQ
jgi:hypothetical protein